MLMLTGLEVVAVLSAALFDGAALYINVVEHPARMCLDTRMAAVQWAPSYKRATWLQAPLAIVSLLCGVAVWLLGGGVGWLVAALLVGAVQTVGSCRLCGQALPFASSARAINRLTRDTDKPSSLAIAVMLIALAVCA